MKLLPSTSDGMELATLFPPEFIENDENVFYFVFWNILGPFSPRSVDVFGYSIHLSDLRVVLS
ncbi:MAG: hypothetical protein ACXABU_05085 [Candidatus Hodarchaeales archaeon]